MLTSGRLTERVDILMPSVLRGNFGEQQVTYEHIITVWAGVVYQKGSQALTSGELWVTRSITVTMRNNKVINERCRLKWDEKIYKIESFNRSKADGSVTIVASMIDEGTDE